jgi:uncharacterized membrane protein HdeD (DUF308 family)
VKIKEETQMKILSAVANLLVVLGVLQFLAGVWLLDSWQATAGAVVMMFLGTIMSINLRLLKIEKKLKTKRSCTT